VYCPVFWFDLALCSTSLLVTSMVIHMFLGLELLITSAVVIGDNQVLVLYHVMALAINLITCIILRCNLH